MNILFVTHAPPDPSLDGSRLIPYHLARELAGEHCLYLCSLVAAAEPSAPHLQEWFTASEFVPWATRPRFQKWAASLVDDVPLWVRVYDVPAMRSAIRNMLEQNQIDVIHCDTGSMTQYVNAMGNVPRVVAPHDSLARALEQQVQYASDGLRRFAARSQVNKMRRYEAETYARFDRVIVVSANERAYLQALAPQLHLDVIPNGVNTDDFAPSSIPETPHSLGFVGMMNFVPNQAATFYFTREILPRIQREIPDATFTIIGRDPTAEIRELAATHIRVTGTVDDVRPYIASQSVIVCPLRATGGVKNKLLEAMAMGKAIVATPEAADGLDVRDGDQVLLAANAEAFAGACVTLLRDRAARARLGQNARAWTLQHTWKKCAADYVRVYQEVIDAAAGR